MTTELIITLVLVGFVVILVALHALKRNPPGDWHPRAFCKCGWSTYATFGDLFHVHREVCPDCGRGKHDWELKTARRNNGRYEVLGQSETEALS